MNYSDGARSNEPTEFRRFERPGPHLSIVIPAFKEGRHISVTLDRIASFVAECGWSTEVLVVDDGSRDATPHIVETRAANWPPQSRLRLLTHSANRGKGAAVRTGVLASRGAYVIFTDADLAYSTEPFARITERLDAGSDVVIGVRSRRAGLIRAVMGWAFAMFVRLLGLTDVTDTQCGIKGFRSSAAGILFGLATVDDFAFDVEILFLAKAYGFRVDAEPVDMRLPDHTSMQFRRDVPRMIRSLLSIRRRAKTGLYEIPSPRPRGRKNF